MTTDTTLSPDTYAVLARVPLTWWPAADVEREIATALERSLGNVRSRLTHLRRLKLIEYRKRQTLAPTFEVRRIGRE